MVSYNPKLFLLFFILVAFVTLFKLYYPNSSTLVHDKHLDRNLSEDEVFQLFKDWKKEYGRLYKDHEEMAKKFGIFISNLNYIIESNARRTSPSSHILGLNKFSDWSDEEFNETYLNNEEMLIEDNDIPTENHIEMNNLSYTEVPSSLDWRVKGAVTAVKNQMTPPFCWAFSAVGAIEGIHAIVTNNLISLSEQELVDCVTENHLGKRTDGFKWVINNGGIASDADYPYTGQKGTCQASKGIYEGGECSIDTKLNHGLLIVGYDRSEEGVDYWIAKNSWGKDWGKDGYIWIRRNTDLPYGVCGINKKAYYPKKNVRSLASV